MVRAIDLSIAIFKTTFFFHIQIVEQLAILVPHTCDLSLSRLVFLVWSLEETQCAAINEIFTLCLFLLVSRLFSFLSSEIFQTSDRDITLNREFGSSTQLRHNIAKIANFPAGADNIKRTRLHYHRQFMFSVAAF